MSLEERDAILAMLAARRDASDNSPDARRLGFERFASALWADAAIPPAIVIAPGLTARWAPAPPAANQPILLWLHGGAFTVGSSASHWPMAAMIGTLSGLAVLLPDYARAPERPFPAALDDTRAALRWLAGQGFCRTAIGGDSAGGNLAVAAVQHSLKEGLPLPSACWLISPYLDLTHGGASIAGRRARDRFVNPDDGTNLSYAGGTALDNPAVSPLFGSVGGFPETLLQVGSEEVLFDDARWFAQRLWAAGGTVCFQEWQGMMHVWPLFAPRLEEGRWALAQGAAFLRQIFQA